MSSFLNCCIPQVEVDWGHNDRFEYLVLLNDDDLEPKWWRKSKLENITTVAKDLNGQCHWALYHQDVCGCCQRRFRIKGMLQKHVLYVLLPKEKMYVLPAEWDREYMKSQLHEILYIFRKLGAREITVSLRKKYNCGQSLNANAGFNAWGIDPSIGVSIESGTENTVHIKTKIKLSSVPLEVTLMKEKAYLESSSRHPVPIEVVEDRFVDRLQLDDRIHYLPTQHDWMHFIKERVKAKARSIQYTYVYHHGMTWTCSVFAKLQNVGVQVGNHVQNTDDDSIDTLAVF
jgi:hypothetical protein